MSNGRFPAKYNWDTVGDAVIKAYVEGASTVFLEREYGIPVGAIAAFLGRKGVRRTGKQAKQVAQEQGRMNTRPSNKRICLICTEAFQPNGPNQQRCKQCIPNQRFVEYYNRYGVSKRDWDRIFTSQNSTCALCTRAPDHIDHDHVTDIVRGLLCAGCNLAVNRVEEDGWAARASNYIKNSDTGCRVNKSSGYWNAWRTENKHKKDVTARRRTKAHRSTD